MPELITQTIPATYGLVVCGGNSSRMGTDKSMLQYYEKPQRYHVYEMLQPFCEKVFISCKEEQAATIDESYHVLADSPAYNNTGPMAALLTAFTQFPQTNILFIGCDYPFLNKDDLKQFSVHCKENPAAFYNDDEAIYEPLLAWYPYQSFNDLKKMHEAKQYSLQHFLKGSQAIKFHPENKRVMQSVDTQEEFENAQHLIKS